MAREGTASNTDLYLAIESQLKKANEPLTCVDLFDRPEIRKNAVNKEHVSNALGYMWRRGYIKRQAAPHVIGEQAKYAYWMPLGRTVVIPKAIPEEPVTPVKSSGRPKVNVYDDGRTVEIEFSDLTLSIRLKR